jgi:mannose-6-phosphate isomerase-like protein (cupin superfamily)
MTAERSRRIVNRKDEPKMQKIRLAEKLASFNEQWSPKIVGELNGQHVKLVKFQGEFVWHHHDLEDEFFLVVRGSFRMDYRDELGGERSLEIAEGEFVIVPRGTEHRPYAAEEAHVLLFEPLATLNTGNVRSERTIEAPEAI